MSKPQQLQNDVEFVRCNLRVLQDIHPDLFDHLSRINEKGRAEEIRYLMRLGLMVKNGQLGGLPAVASPVHHVVAQDIPSNAPTSETVASSGTSADSQSSSNVTKPADSNTVSLDESDLDFGDDLLGLD
ncbi:MULTISPECIES: hypothetical protein [Vibrio]|uniref:hypothetical protein n=1 Tax=Vibrio TaxID=662 RepID=UPI001B81D70B|nr:MULTISPECIES: hypothetical protein [Vibrio]BDP38267.1 hypothetical protein VA208B3_46380 [Vibrio alginolyticus]MDF5646492.1 hypothetical protein [Vibrio parahaemolyticus]MDF5666250.1 hypothetical protein [Vibrio parahaemolyticus]WKV19505.1 hypothetical protein [Vibrio parahaemolyticus]BDP33492.1 hypothetical protein VV208B2_45720 [Vibrio vulnificus]